MNAIFLALPVLIPLAAGTVIYLFRFESAKKRNLFTACAIIANSLTILCLILFRPAEALPLVRLTDSITLSLRLDALGSVFLALIAFLWPIAIFYSFEYMEHEHSQERFFAFYTLSYGVTAGIAMSADLITMYFFYELLTLVTVPLVAHEEDRRSQRAARKYIIYSIGGAALSFVGIVMLYKFGGVGSFTPGGFAKAADGDGQKMLLIAYFLTFVGFGVKSAIFPLHGWLPSAGVAPTPVTALLHAVAVVKSGVFASMRSTLYAFGPELLRDSWAQYAAMLIAAVTIVYGSAMALREQHLKRRLAYSTVSNLSYILFGMTLLTSAGFSAALSHMLFHGIMKITLFFCAGTVLCKTGREYVPQTEGLGRKMPLTFTVYLIASLALTGAPFLPGFISKMNLINAAAAEGSGFALAGIIALLVSALLTGAYLIPMSVRAFVPREGAELSFTEKDRDPGLRMLIPFAVLCAAMLVFGVHASPLMQVLEELAAAIN